MKKFRLPFVLLLICFTLFPIDAAYAKKGTQVLIPDTVKDPHSKLTAKYESANHQHCTAILISSTVAITAKHCGGDDKTSFNGTIYPGESGLSTPFGYMNVRVYIPHPKYDIALLKGTERDQSKAYRYYIRKFKTQVTGFGDKELQGFLYDDIYSYGYPYKRSVYKQYRSDGQVIFYQRNPLLLRTSLPAYEGQSGSGVFKKDGQFIGIIITRTPQYEGNVLPFTKEIAQWINDHS
ncbi:trypsin-like serine peptidase [Staphylococcus intermedius]|uniref:Serine protease n=1 Tax=Staphylococcus intermedius NCTC 11048 TaxID=1141106 RepID=A0A380GAZ5_STAIN|nr:trypsin-like peptidase domain-containing protein [Staphylococcus intermedius]PCF65612.1 serine protease [Staphylococcus intermedius]PCF81291.1 serine protease [Staphylococcus intermedius]PCF82574.1 serine protease [Staphylococcus intermedius]PCF87273.1 serine protease [Staphylococcus intermedius]PNZ54057.1 serine protease [Staphylococcus intermedius NCTC 11048]